MNFNEECISFVGSGSVDLNAAADTEVALYTVPKGKEFIPDHVAICDLSDDALAAVITLGKAGGSCDEFLGDQTLANLDGITKTTKLRPLVSATPPAWTVMTAGEVFACEITTPAGAACTATFEVFGHERDA